MRGERVRHPRARGVLKPESERARAARARPFARRCTQMHAFDIVDRHEAGPMTFVFHSWLAWVGRFSQGRADKFTTTKRWLAARVWLKGW